MGKISLWNRIKTDWQSTFQVLRLDKPTILIVVLGFCIESNLFSKTNKGQSINQSGGGP
jgi:hypothetical protein